MADSEKLTTTVSTKGQVILPSAIRKRREWGAGTRLVVEDTPEGVLLKPAPTFAATRPQDVFGSLPHSGRLKTLEEMDAGVLAETRRRQARD
ncbi:AbrB family transcriptional regulator [Mesorhizobium erdmanii]|uniref:AbrB family transcriptional regulator n=2 Tax=Mesorhizobium TaxID=68287 RepID=A0A3M9XB66_9HYPH|nr:MULTISPECIES: AbrB/MazE/SpoVT family DNA-binding domain-containing protein [Mesorhizobium]RNJ45273.1 AbrB family transcriptional regulator [Mesorhizobium japonicum]RXT52075.1 AbrB family transcriptional regulator [Mesorhizobium erdmanii]